MILIYKINLGGYDEVLPCIYQEPQTRYVLFTDDKKIKPEGWEIIYVKPEKDILRQSRKIKIKIHEFVSDFDVYIYLDANYTIKKSLVEYVQRYFRGGMLMHWHNERNCTYEEAKSIVSKGIDLEENVFPQMRKYEAEKLPKRFGLTQNGFFIRDNSANYLCDFWYDEVKNGSYRDQLSFMYCAFLNKNIQISFLDGHYFQSYLSLKKHAKDREKLISKVKTAVPKIWYFTPGRGDKNLGEAYNMHCAAVPENDWICIMDGDVLFLNPYWSKQIEDIIVKHGEKYHLISCLTNRLGINQQLPYGFSEDPNILNHAEIADKHYKNYYDDVVPASSQTAGLFMLFPKKTWNQVKFLPGLTNNGVFVDFSFADSVMKKLGRIGIAKGIYIFHFYRFNRKSKMDYDHLK